MSNETMDRLDQAILESLSVCRGVVQRYLAYIQGVEPAAMFPAGVQETNEVGFIDKAGLQWTMRLDIVDDMLYRFPSEKCPGKAVTDAMHRILLNLPIVCAMVLEHDVKPADVAHPELFMDSEIRITPYMTGFLYNKNIALARKLHDRCPKRIGFRWTAEGVAAQPQSIDVARAATDHPDNFTGPVGAKNMTDAEATQLAIAITMPEACITCGRRDGECGCGV